MSHPKEAHHAAEKAALSHHFPGEHAVVKAHVSHEGEAQTHNMGSGVHAKHHKHHKTGFHQPDVKGKGVGNDTAHGKGMPAAVDKGHLKHHKHK
jgi:hypothetical protein